MFVLTYIMFIPLVGVSNARSVVETTVGGSGAVVQTDITTSVNGETSHYESSQPGYVKVENNNGSVTIETDRNTTPTIVASPPTTSSETQKEAARTTVQNHMNTLGQLLANMLQRLRSLLRFRL